MLLFYSCRFQAVFKLRAVEYAFFKFIFYVYSNEAFAKSFIKKSFFNTNFKSSFQDVVFYRILRFKPCDTEMAAL